MEREHDMRLNFCILGSGHSLLEWGGGDVCITHHAKRTLFHI